MEPESTAAMVIRILIDGRKAFAERHGRMARELSAPRAMGRLLLLATRQIESLNPKKAPKRIRRIVSRGRYRSWNKQRGKA